VSTTLIIVLAVAVGLPLLLAILFKALWKVPAADEALIVTGFAASRSGVDGKTFKIVTGGGGVAIFKVGDDERSITNAATRFLDAQSGRCTTSSARSSTGTCARSPAD
jgi:flotillin